MGLEIAPFFENKSILVTGATGFLGKVFVEKILQVQPNVKKLFLLVRAPDTSSAAKRLHEDIIQKGLFEVLNQGKEGSIDRLTLERIVAVPGDVCFENLGIKDPKMREEMWEEIDIIVNSAATTNFDERYDVALAINAFGPANLMKFASKCANIKMFLHVSTAYVCGEREGLVLEKPFLMGETLDGSNNLDIDGEQKLAMGLLRELRGRNASDMEITHSLKNLGIHRARLHGWPNTYSFTKAMGEMLLGHLKRAHMSLLIFRPTIVTSTFEQPFPGWTENLKTIDSVAFAYGKGKLKLFFGNPHTTVDVIPVDMVVNAMIVGAVMITEGKPTFPRVDDDYNESIIYHIGSSSRNPITLARLQVIIRQYFERNPWIDRDGRSVRVGKLSVISNMFIFWIFMYVQHLIFTKALGLASSALRSQKCRDLYANLNQKIKVAVRLSDLYKPYAFFKGIFDDSNTEALRNQANENGVDFKTFNFDPASIISWEDYFVKVHFPGVLRAIKHNK